ncbi:hypothetical protein GCM10009841_04650 [Microlunatus panaciterrae]|uniref:Type II secretion system (T2SS), protein F n=1 Tax=Microlunatus panaciterrae TaxID=400768 RepID=A0ABS2RK58_9ACTN|nr:hypothetical protein [Microlunatus panaciterrae]MBM7798877.1 hypothetical protein [Microlunatus panaciterrae]
MTFAIVLLTGILLAGGVLALVTAFLPVTPHLADTLNGLNEPWPEHAAGRPTAAGASRSDRLGGWLHRHSPLPLTARQRQNLRIQDRSVAEFYGDKAAMAIVGALCPGLVAAAWSLVTGWSPAVPGLVTLVGATIGYFVPDLTLRRQAGSVRSDASEALLTFIDLVTLERMANASATQALHNAANLSDVALFAQIRAALERARLEQRAPYPELRRLATQLNLPELTDVADTMQLDESGAALSGALRARLRELRDAHFTQAQTEASAVSEGMTIYMTVPALIFGLIFMVPPLLRIVTG